jgi:hypothetical protein
MVGEPVVGVHTYIIHKVTYSNDEKNKTRNSFIVFEQDNKNSKKHCIKGMP